MVKIHHLPILPRNDQMTTEQWVIEVKEVVQELPIRRFQVHEPLVRKLRTNFHVHSILLISGLT